MAGDPRLAGIPLDLFLDARAYAVSELEEAGSFRDLARLDARDAPCAVCSSKNFTALNTSPARYVCEPCLRAAVAARLDEAADAGWEHFAAHQRVLAGCGETDELPPPVIVHDTAFDPEDGYARTALLTLERARDVLAVAMAGRRGILAYQAQLHELQGSLDALAPHFAPGARIIRMDEGSPRVFRMPGPQTPEEEAAQKRYVAADMNGHNGAKERFKRLCKGVHRLAGLEPSESTEQ
jgi:hypothetical protein